MKYTIDHIPLTTPYNRRPGLKMEPEYITIHSTGNPNSTARNERVWLTNPQNDRTASYHVVVDEKEAIEVIPLNEVAWHAGDGTNGTGNRKSISIEICESGDKAKTIMNAAELVAKMLKERGWGVDRLRRHYDWSGTICPRIMSANNWDGWRGFILEVERRLKGLPNTPSAWAKEALEWAKKEGITDGTNPQGTATREQVVTMLYRFSKTIAKQNNREGT